MEFRTTVNIKPSLFRITYQDPVIFIGSCFAISIGQKFETGHMPVIINPSGTVFNPASVSNTLDNILERREYTPADLDNHNGTWFSFNHYTDFSSDDPTTVLKEINWKSGMAADFIRKAKYLFITFGTARVYRLKTTGKIVSNCHKLPSEIFTEEMLSVAEVVDLWTKQLNIIESRFPELKIVFTISPVRHWKDGAHENMISKSVLFLAVEELLRHSSAPQYFPAYEIMMDDLRDYRFYETDMLHPSAAAIDYIWDKFTSCYFDSATLSLWKEAENISRAYKHLVKGQNRSEAKKFANVMLKRISETEAKIPGISFGKEKEHFLKML